MVLNADKATSSFRKSKLQVNRSFINSRGASAWPSPAHPQYQQLFTHYTNFFPSLETHTAHLDNARFNAVLQKSCAQWFWAGLLHKPGEKCSAKGWSLPWRSDTLWYFWALLPPPLDPPELKIVSSSSSREGLISLTRDTKARPVGPELILWPNGES